MRAPVTFAKRTLSTCDDGFGKSGLKEREADEVDTEYIIIV